MQAVGVITFTFLGKNLKDFFKKRTIKTMTFVVQKILYNLFFMQKI